eukprot:06093_2
MFAARMGACWRMWRRGWGGRRCVRSSRRSRSLRVCRFCRTRRRRETASRPSRLRARRIRTCICRRMRGAARRASYSRLMSWSQSGAAPQTQRRLMRSHTTWPGKGWERIKAVGKTDLQAVEEQCGGVLVAGGTSTPAT